jgi:hypothetical protein
LADPAVISVDVGRSDDHPGEAAIVLYLEHGKQHGKIPAEVDGVRTKVIFQKRFTAQNVAPQAGDVLQTGQPLSQDELRRAAAAKESHRAQLMADPAILATGVGASNDNPEEAAVVIYVDRSAPAPLIPLEIDGARTKVITIEAFRAYGWNKPAAETCRANHPARR